MNKATPYVQLDVEQQQKYGPILEKKFDHTILDKFFNVEKTEHQNIYRISGLAVKFYAKTYRFGYLTSCYFEDTGYANIKPITIDQFVSDCQRENIDLQWKV